jgi:hypothetical protein
VGRVVYKRKIIIATTAADVAGVKENTRLLVRIHWQLRYHDRNPSRTIQCALLERFNFIQHGKMAFRREQGHSQGCLPIASKVKV